MGKTETARMFAGHGVPVCDSDVLVHQLYERGGAAVTPVSDLFPDALVDGRIDRERLSRAVIGKPDEIKKLELIVHPLVGRSQWEFLKKNADDGAAMVVLDIPLLLEASGPKRVDVVVVVSAPADMQRARVLARSGMTTEKFEAILKKQMPDIEKRSLADYVIDTSQGLDHAERQVVALIENLRGQNGKIWVTQNA